MKEVKEYIRCFKEDNEYNEKRNGDYYEPWLSLTKKGIGYVKSFIGEFENGLEQQFNYFGSYGDDYVNADIIESNITAIDGENQTVTVDGYVFSQDNKYFYSYQGESQTTGTVERTWIEEIQFDEQTLQISACTVNGTTFVMNNYDGEQYYWLEVDFDTMSVGSKTFFVDHELQVNESVTMTEQLRFNGYTSEEPVVGVLFKYINYTNSTMKFISKNGRRVQVGDTDGVITVKTIVETEEGETINRVNYNKTEYEKLLETPLTFDVQSNGNIVVSSQNYNSEIVVSSQNYNLEYKKNDGEWIEVTSSTGGTVVSVVSGDTIQFRGNNSNGISSSIFSGTTSQFIIKGNIMSLLNKEHFNNLTSVPSSCFENLFANCTGLTDASKLLLPATTLAGYCYRFMFHGCTSLITAPSILPATTLAANCYNSMFNGCTSLATTPELPSTTLANYCYYYMFEGCTSLTTAPELPATTLASNCYGYMFYDCTSLTTAPELPATTLVNGCYRQMFQNCSNLNYIKCLATNKSAANCTYNWVNGVAPVGVFIKDSNMTGWTVGIDGIPEGWLTNEEKNIALSSNVKYISELGEVFSLKVAATSNWVASTTDNWISMSQRQGGLGVITITINTNQTVTPRNGEITFVCGNKTVVLKVVQDNSYLEPLTFEIQSNGNIVWKANNTAYTVTLEYSKNGGEWTEITSTTGGTTISVVSGDTVQFRGNEATMSYNYNYNHFSGTSCSFSLKGNIMSLINSTGFNELTALTSTYTFYNLFRNCTGLTDASELLLPATTLADTCYSMMFWGCTSLTTAPQLPATTLAQSCYYGMFTDCWLLTTAPELPATTLAIGCYKGMFTNCWSLTTAPELPVTTLAESCYSSMFDGCSGLTTAPVLPATTLTSYCYNSMFEDCTSLTTAPELPATTLAYYCYDKMFSGCTSLTTAPSILPATTLIESCYVSMFAGCTSLTTAPELPATTLAGWCYDGMFRGCTSLTTAPALPATTLANLCYIDMFYDCTSLTRAPELPATTLTSQCYQSMFEGCSNLNYIKCLATNISATNCTSNWVSGVASTGTFVAADRATLWKRGINGIPTNWNVQYVDERMSVVPLTFEIRSSGTIRWKASSTAYTATLQYSKNGGGWTTLKSTTGGATIYVVSGDTVQFRGDNATMCDKSFRYNSFNGTIGQFALKGNIMSLINSTGFSELSTLTSASTFYFLFNNCTGLTDASELLLPATTLTEYCYANMFKGCTNLVSAPELPATTLAQECYDSMFYGCTSLTTAPVLSATTLANQCYDSMFRGCTGLTTAPELPATTLANNCYQYMFYGCTSLTTAPELPATTLADYCYQYMFQRCTGLTTAPSMLPATTLAQYCYYYMFNNCTELTQAPELPATTLAQYCYQSMFEGCSNLNYIKCLATDISASNCTFRWVAAVAASGTFVKDSNMTRWLINNNGIPVGWVTYNDNELALSEASKYAPESGSVIQLKVISPSNWSASTTDNWITMSQTQGSGGVTDVTIVVGSSTTPRDGTVTFVCGEISVVFKIVQNNIVFMPLTFEIESNGNIVWKAYNTAYTVTLEYSKNGGEWTSITSTTGGTTIPVVSGDTVQFRGNNATMSSGSSRYNCFSGTTCQFAVKNNIMSLLDSTNFSTLTMLQSAYTFGNLFSYCTGLTNASKLILPATTLTMGCYYLMFNGCKSLTTTPELPAATLANQCYQYMFYECTSLTTAPELPATTLAQSCYSGMFEGCTGLTTAPALPATTLARECYDSMFRNCSSLVQAPALPATTLAYSCYEYMFNNCISLTTAPALPATALAQSCYGNMFNGCTSLTTAPALPATTLRDWCYYRMFSGCTSLVSAPELPATTLAENCYNTMFSNCASLVSAPALPATTLAKSCYIGMFQSCTSLTTAPALPATTLAQECYGNMFSYCTSLVSAPSILPATTLASYCYYFMFAGCTGLTQAPELPATTLASACYANMFQSCTSLTTAPALPATTLAHDCYGNMFEGCTSLTTAPALPATTLASACYSSMFFGCRNLNYIKCLATDISATGCTSYWVGNVSSTGTFVKAASMTGWGSGLDGIPTNWTVQDAS